MSMFERMRKTTGRLGRTVQIVTIMAFPTIAPAAAQDLENGHQIARRWCSGCHEIGNAPVHNDVSPPFTTIARMPSTTELSLHAFLSTPHKRMPDYSLTRQEIADISAYIVSLK